jgi:endonuclease III
MKNATKHADDLKHLYKRLLRDGKPAAIEPMEPLDALVRGAMSYDVSDTRAQEAMRAIGKEFVDLNELRVATDLEIQELLGQRYPAIEQRVAMITQALNNIFEREHTMSLNRLKTVSKREARQFLRELPEIHPFVEAYVMLMSLEGHAFPVDDAIVAVLRENEIVEENTALDESQRFVEHHLKAEEAYEFYALVRVASQDGNKRKSKP